LADHDDSFARPHELSSIVAGDDLAVVTADQVGQRLEIDRGPDRLDAAVAEDEQADTGVRAAEAAVGQGAVLVLGRPQRPLIASWADASHAADGVVLAAEDAAVLVLAAQRIGADVFLAEHQGVAGPIGDARQAERPLPAEEDRDAALVLPV